MHLLEKLYNSSDIMELAVQQCRADLVLEQPNETKKWNCYAGFASSHGKQECYK